MTNKEKFEEVFGYKPNTVTDDIENCMFSESVCEQADFDCDNCPFLGWWDKEYKPCFKLREDLK